MERDKTVHYYETVNKSSADVTWTIPGTFSAGDTIEFDIKVTANHGGIFEFRYLCADSKETIEYLDFYDKDLTLTSSSACYADNRESNIWRDSGDGGCYKPRNLIRTATTGSTFLSSRPEWYILSQEETCFEGVIGPAADKYFAMSYQLPSSLSTCASKVIVQWWWQTSNGCIFPEWRDANDQGIFPCDTGSWPNWGMSTCDAATGTKEASGEQFVNCLDLALSVGSSTPTPSPVPTPTPSPVPTPVPTPSPTPPPSPSPVPTPSPNLPSGYTLPSIGSGSWSCGGNGYNCQSGSDAFGGGGNCCNAQEHAYACVDWSVGSFLWQSQETCYKGRTGEDVYFGVGSFGIPSDGAMGKCFKMSIDEVDRPGIFQVINTGSDVHSKQFDLQQMAGGIGLCNALTSTTDGFVDGSTSGDALYPMFAGDNAPWGPRKYGGFENRDGCDSIPEYPNGADPSMASFSNNEMDLRTMCHVAYDLKFRVDSGVNPTIVSGTRVPCPEEIYRVTGLRLADDNTFTDTEGFTDGGVTRMWDGCKPSAGWSGNVQNTDPSYPAVVPCGRDGISRVTISGYAGTEPSTCESSPTPTPSP
eukprot:g4080.t1